MNKVELLAPAGSSDAGYAALEYGADAVYLGLPQFSARAEAVNFTPDEFYNIVGYAHKLNRKVYVTLNTLIKETELPAVVETLSAISEAQADALIVQDLGVVRLINYYFPQLRIHASTQMAIHNKAGAEYLLKMGIKRVTLARELSFSEITAIAALDNLETESFLHGALCYSYSGLCMFSSMHSGRSANRGRCAYSCREIFMQPESKLQGHAFSLCDLELSQHIDELLATGVNSLKIEGRKKSPLYVAAVVRLYRELLDKKCTPERAAANSRDVETIFSRQTCSFFTSGSKGEEGRSKSLDTAAVGHRGTKIGRAEKLTRKSKEYRLTFTTEQPFEKHDGLQIDDPEQERPFGFPVNELFIRNNNGREKPAFTADAGDTVTVILPADTPAHLQGETVYLASSQRLKRELKWHTPKDSEFNRRYRINVEVEINENLLIANARVTDIIHGADKVSATASYRHEENFDTARNPEQTAQALENNFSKTGSTPFTLHEFSLSGNGSLFIPASISNSLRRDLYEKLQSNLKIEIAARNNDITTKIKTDSANDRTVSPTETKYWSVKIDKYNRLKILQNIATELFSQINEVIIEIHPQLKLKEFREDLTQFKKLFPELQITLGIPIIARADEEKKLSETIAEFIEAGQVNWQAGNLWALQVLKQYPDLKITAATTLYTLNHLSREQQLELGLQRVMLSIEDEKNNLNELINTDTSRTALTVYQDIPLFIGEACSYSSFNKNCSAECSERNSSRLWQTRHGNSYLLQKDNCRTTLINKQAFSLSGRLTELNNLKYCEIDFINRNYTATEMSSIITATLADQRIPDTHCGNFLRKLQ